MKYRRGKHSHNDKAVKYEGQYLKASDIFYKQHSFIKQNIRSGKSPQIQ